VASSAGGFTFLPEWGDPAPAVAHPGGWRRPPCPLQPHTREGTEVLRAALQLGLVRSAGLQLRLKWILE